MFVLTGRMIRLEATSSNGHNEQDMPCAFQQKCCGTCGTCGTASSRTKRLRGREPESKSLVLRHLRHRRHRDRDRSAGRQPARSHPRRCGTCGTLRHCAPSKIAVASNSAMVPVKSLWPRCGRRRILRHAEARYSRFKLATPSLSVLFKLRSCRARFNPMGEASNASSPALRASSLAAHLLALIGSCDSRHPFSRQRLFSGLAIRAGHPPRLTSSNCRIAPSIEIGSFRARLKRMSGCLEVPPTAGGPDTWRSDRSD